MTSEARVGGPWYVHFWPWFIVCLLGVSIVASLWTVRIAYRLGDIESGATGTTLSTESESGLEAQRRTTRPMPPQRDD